MPYLGSIILILQVVFVVHAIRRGHGYMWVLIILIFPLVGILAYLIVVMLPEMQNSRATIKASSVIKKAINPKGDLRQYTQEVEISDTVANKIRLAEELLSQGMAHDAVATYEHCRNGLFKDDPGVLLGLAKCYFATEQFTKTKDTLDHLIETNPDFKSQDGHLLYARTQEALANTDDALEEYETLIAYYSGAEAKCRYGLLLKQQGQVDKADRLFREIITTAERSSGHHRKLQRQWIDVARKQIS